MTKKKREISFNKVVFVIISTNMINIISVIFLSIFLPGFSSLNQEELQATDNLYILPISTTNDLITVNECSFETIKRCLSNAFSNLNCFASIYYQRLLPATNEIDVKKKDYLFRKYIEACSLGEFNNTIKNAESLSILRHYSGGVFGNRYSVYPNCLTPIKECFDVHPTCVVPLQYKIFDQIINICSDSFFTHFNFTFLPSKPPMSTYIDDLEILAANKIGPILDSYTSSLPSKIIQIFGNLTYEEFDALKTIAARESFLKHQLCDSNPKFPLPFRAVQKRMDLSLKTPILQEKVYTLYNKFTPEIIEAVKAMLKVHPHLRWSFCSSIFAISPSKELLNVFSPPVTKWTLQNCRVIADNSSSYYSAICKDVSDYWLN